MLALAAIVTILSPVTEMMAHLDNFPRGGDDFELSCFAVIALLCLVLLAALCNRKLVDDLLKEPLWEPREFWQSTPLLISRLLGDMAAWVPPRQLFSLGAFALPLRI